MSYCFVCKKAQGRGLLWRLARDVAEDVGVCEQNRGQQLYELGFSPCCGWSRNEGARRRLLGRMSKKKCAETHVEQYATQSHVTEEQKGVELLITPGAGLDRSFLDGLHPTPWISSPKFPEVSGLKCELSARIERGPVASTYKSKDNTLVNVRLEVRCKTACEERISRTIVALPAPQGGYIVFRDRRQGVRLCVNLRTVPKVNEVNVKSFASSTEASLLVGATGWHNRMIVPRTLRLLVRWRQQRAISACLRFKNDGSGVPLEHVVRSLLRLEGHLSSETIQSACDICERQLIAHVPPTFFDGTLRRENLMSNQLKDLLLVGLLLPTTAPQREEASVVSNILLRGSQPEFEPDVEPLVALSLPTAQNKVTSLAPATVSRTDGTADLRDGLDCLCYLVAAAFRPQLAPGVEEPAEQAMDTLAPCNVSEPAVRKAIEDTLTVISKDLAKSISKKRHVQYTWEPEDKTCPLCGLAGSLCERCGIMRGESCWREAPRLSTASSELSQHVAFDCARVLPRLMVQRLKGGGTGVRATDPVEEKGKLRRRTPCLVSTHSSLHDATMVTTGIRSSQVHSAWVRRRASRRKRGTMCNHFLNEKKTQQTRAIPPGILFAPSCLEDQDDECCAIEAVQAAVVESRRIAPKGKFFTRVQVEGCSLSERIRYWKRKREELDCVGDEIGQEAEVELTLEQASKLPRLVRKHIENRMADFRVGEIVSLGTKCGKVLKRVHVKVGEETRETAELTIGKRLPREGDNFITKDAKVLRLEAIEVETEEGSIFQNPALLTKLPPRLGDPASLSPLAYVNAIFAERQGRVNVRLNGGHTAVVVQRKRLSSLPLSPSNLLRHQLQKGELGLWHVDTMANEEHCLYTDQRQKQEEAHDASYTLPLGELQLHCSRSLSMVAPPGHPIRQGPILRAVQAFCTAWPSDRNGDSYGLPAVTGPSSWCPGGAHVSLFAVMMLDDVDGTSFEDAGSTSLRFGSEQGRCFLSSSRVTAKSRIATREEVLKMDDPFKQVRHLDSDGRARGFLLKGSPLAYLKDGSTLRSPIDGWVECWGSSLRDASVVTLLQEHGWQSGMKVVANLQKSALTSIPNSLSAPVPVSFLRAESSCISRNAPATFVSSLALRLLLARGLRLESPKSRNGLPGIVKLLLEEDCALERIYAARQLSWGICTEDKFPLLFTATGKRAGIGRVLLQEMGLPLDKAAVHVVTMHVGGKKRRGQTLSMGQSLEVMEKEVTQLTRDGNVYDASRGPVQDANPPERKSAWRSTLSLMNCGMLKVE